MFGMQGLFKRETKEAVIVSPFEVTITNHGEPLKNTKVVLWYYWNTSGSEDGFQEELFTDENGLLKVPLIKREIEIANLIPTTANQTLKITLDGSMMHIWDVSKGDFTKYGELGFSPEEMICELTDTEYLLLLDSDVVTRCRFNGFEKLEKKRYE